MGFDTGPTGFRSLVSKTGRDHPKRLVSAAYIESDQTLKRRVFFY